MVRIISTRSIQFNNEELYAKQQQEPHGLRYETNEFRILDTVSVIANEPIDVPEWVVATDHFKLLQQAGDVKDIKSEFKQVSTHTKEDAGVICLSLKQQPNTLTILPVFSSQLH